jgi:hypothetical protein
VLDDIVACRTAARGGHVERCDSAGKAAIGTHCKRAGMHWTVAGADAIIALLCCKLNGRFEDFWERRSLAMAAAA